MIDTSSFPVTNVRAQAEAMGVRPGDDILIVGGVETARFATEDNPIEALGSEFRRAPRPLQITFGRAESD